MISISDIDRRTELLTTEQIKAADKLAAEAGIPGLTLIEAAGQAIAQAAIRMLTAHKQQYGCRIAIFCGPGNNGGDGFAAARLLHDRGFKVEVFLASAVEKLAGDAAHMAAAWQTRGEILALEMAGPSTVQSSLIIDALFGVGLSRPLAGKAADAVRLINANSQVPTLAVDIPSGIDGNTGQPIGLLSVRATQTVTFFRLKPGHVLYPGRRASGQLILADIGIPDGILRQSRNDPDSGGPGRVAPFHMPGFVLPDETPGLNLITAHDAARPWQDERAHKYDRGHVVVVSGPFHRTGAARLAARAALRTGAGLVTVASPENAVASNAAHLTAIMIAPFNDAAELAVILGDKRI